MRMLLQAGTEVGHTFTKGHCPNPSGWPRGVKTNLFVSARLSHKFTFSQNPPILPHYCISSCHVSWWKTGIWYLVVEYWAFYGLSFSMALKSWSLWMVPCHACCKDTRVISCPLHCCLQLKPSLILRSSHHFLVWFLHLSLLLLKSLILNPMKMVKTPMPWWPQEGSISGVKTTAMVILKVHHHISLMFLYKSFWDCP